VYKVESADEAGHEVALLPEAVLPAYASSIDLLMLHPWGGESLRRTDPESPMRTHVFGADGAGLAIYLVLEDQQRVVVLRVLWSG
jgi:hypothetical protein